MARFRADEADKYKSSGSGLSFFQLKNDKDSAQVRFMYQSADDIFGDSVHKIELEGAKFGRYVSCLRTYDQPKDVCPLCLEGNNLFSKIFIPVYNIDADEIQLWERGNAWVNKLVGEASRRKGQVCSSIYEIVRNGKAGDTKTNYDMFYIETDDIVIEDLPEIPEFIGPNAFVLEKTAEEMNYYLDYGKFPADTSNAQEASSRSRTQQASTNRRPVPASSPSANERPAARGGNTTPPPTRRNVTPRRGGGNGTSTF